MHHVFSTCVPEGSVSFLTDVTEMPFCGSTLGASRKCLGTLLDSSRRKGPGLRKTNGQLQGAPADSLGDGATQHTEVQPSGSEKQRKLGM